MMAEQFEDAVQANSSEAAIEVDDAEVSANNSSFFPSMIHILF